jgi:hypothetical protein
LRHEDFVEGIQQVQAKKKASLNYYAWLIWKSSIKILYSFSST